MGFIAFAAVMIMMSGVFQALAGLVAIFENQFHVATRNYTFEFDVTAWGWIHLVLGVIIALDVFVIWALAVPRGRVAT